MTGHENNNRQQSPNNPLNLNLGFAINKNGGYAKLQGGDDDDDDGYAGLTSSLDHPANIPGQATSSTIATAGMFSNDSLNIDNDTILVRRPDEVGDLKRGLQARHLIMMSIGGTIGTGLFVASGMTIATAGPLGALIAYSVVGTMVFFILTALGEMSTLIPVSGTFHEFASRFVDPGIYVDARGFPLNPDLPGSGQSIWFHNWGIEGAPLKAGLRGVFSVVAIAFFAFGGTELVGVSAGEVEEPRKNVPLAINQTFYRILIFYIGSITVIGLLIPHDDPSLTLSAETSDIRIAPFTLILLRAGLKSASHVMNAVILSAVVSAANSAMYAATRTLVALAKREHAPKVVGFVTDRGVPVVALGVTVSVACLAFLGIIWGEGTVFNWLLSLTGTSGLLTWMSISITHLRFRKALAAQKKPLDNLPYHAPWLPIGNYVAMLIGAIVISGQTYSALSSPSFKLRDLASIFLGVPLFLALFVGRKLYTKSEFVPLDACDFEVRHSDED
ncbi:hypothetical protein HDU76_002304 [Blyttiomyces sp. JEL0837]|nr:hypothetical protein HDU76_002304 [Blyttiomyces sp. JEL0837]